MEQAAYDQTLREIGKRLRELRKEAGYGNHVAFADAVGMEGKNYWKIENGQPFRIVTLLNILDVLGLSLKEFINSIEGL